MFKCLFKGHNYVFVKDVQIFENNHDRYPCRVDRVYECTKCLKVKRVHR